MWGVFLAVALAMSLWAWDGGGRGVREGPHGTHEAMECFRAELAFPNPALVKSEDDVMHHTSSLSLWQWLLSLSPLTPPKYSRYPNDFGILLSLLLLLPSLSSFPLLIFCSLRRFRWQWDDRMASDTFAISQKRIGLVFRVWAGVLTASTHTPLSSLKKWKSVMPTSVSLPSLSPLSLSLSLFLSHFPFFCLHNVDFLIHSHQQTAFDITANGFEFVTVGERVKEEMERILAHVAERDSVDDVIPDMRTLLQLTVSISRFTFCVLLLSATPRKKSLH
jgi:hypothetical protein